MTCFDATSIVPLGGTPATLSQTLGRRVWAPVLKIPITSVFEEGWWWSSDEVKGLWSLEVPAETPGEIFRVRPQIAVQSGGQTGLDRVSAAPQ